MVRFGVFFPSFQCQIEVTTGVDSLPGTAVKSRWSKLMENSSAEEMGDMIDCEVQVRLNNWLDFPKIIRRRAVEQT